MLSLAAINWDTYWLFVLTELALSASPGPAVMLVIAYGLSHGARRSLFAALGVLSANALYFAISATALGALLIASRTARWATDLGYARITDRIAGALVLGAAALVLGVSP